MPSPDRLFRSFSLMPPEAFVHLSSPSWAVSAGYFIRRLSTAKISSAALQSIRPSGSDSVLAFIGKDFFHSS